MKMASILSAGLIASAMAFSTAVVAEQTKQPVAKVSIEETQFGLIIGGSVGG